MKIKISSLLKYIKNKYFISILIFLMIFLFFGENNLMVISRLQGELNALNREADMLAEDIKQDSLEAASLMGNKDALEAYGREHYYMKRPDEDIFILKEEEK